jgi:hypothetical protein
MASKEESTYFLKKRSKKLLPVRLCVHLPRKRVSPTPEAKVFWFFFSKKNIFFCLASFAMTKARRRYKEPPACPP